LFGFPPIFAALHTAPRWTKATQRVAWGFLVAIGVGIFVARMPHFFPKLARFDQRLPLWQDRLLMWYAGVYLVWVIGVLPAHLFLGNLRVHRRGEPAQFSKFTCYLGLLAASLMCLGMPGLFAFLGFWPIL
jgi:hypothetical protein